MEKDFDGWNDQKKEIHAHHPEIFSYPGEIWWVSLSANIGSEMDGKHEKFERPVLVLKVFNKETLLVVPLTTKNKTSIYHVTITHSGRFVTAANLSQIHVISSKRLLRHLTRISFQEFEKVSRAFKEKLI